MDLSRIICVILVSASTIFAQQKPENLGSAINSDFSELNPVMAPDGNTLFFGRKNHPANKYGTQGSETVAGSQDIWYSERVGEAWSTARRMPDVLNRDQYNTILSISPDGQTILLKGSYVNGNYETRGFSLAKKQISGWSIPEKINIPNYERMSKGLNEYAYLSMDGKTLLLAFSEKKKSDRDDIYVSFLQGGGWTKPEKLSDAINSEYSETTPFLAADGMTMYFSSDRPGGQGSQDIYMTKRLGQGWTSWRKPVNIGPPVNTPAYDAYYTLSAKGDFAYFLSSTETGKKDIFRIAVEPEPVVAAVAKEEPIIQQDVKSSPRIASSETSSAVVLLSGKILNSTGMVPGGASVAYEDLKTGKIIGQATPDPSTGQYKLVLPYGINYGITAKADGFLPSSLHLDLSQMRGRYLELDDRDLTMVPIAKGSTMTVNNLFFELNKATLTPESDPELKRMVQVMQDNPSLRIEISGHTDNTGTDLINDRLSQARADAVQAYLLAAGVAQTRIQSKGYGSKKPKVSNETEEGRSQNRRVEFAIL
ncbi:OmpA family protein [Aquirufa sp. OSTEICH-129V]|uniref:OmpA family protein n=1 Tax=Aquirufa avitistagni TaxID=3104728 RepID=A0ABW6DBU6_9BACT